MSYALIKTTHLNFRWKIVNYQQHCLLLEQNLNKIKEKIHNYQELAMMLIIIEEKIKD